MFFQIFHILQVDKGCGIFVFFICSIRWAVGRRRRRGGTLPGNSCRSWRWVWASSVSPHTSSHWARGQDQSETTALWLEQWLGVCQGCRQTHKTTVGQVGHRGATISAAGRTLHMDAPYLSVSVISLRGRQFQLKTGHLRHQLQLLGLQLWSVQEFLWGQMRRVKNGIQIPTAAFRVRDCVKVSPAGEALQWRPVSLCEGRGTSPGLESFHPAPPPGPSEHWPEQWLNIRINKLVTLYFDTVKQRQEPPLNSPTFVGICGLIKQNTSLLLGHDIITLHKP